MKLRDALIAIGFTEEDVDQEIQEAKDELMNMIEAGEFSEAYDYCGDRWGLEPDYLDDLVIL